MTFKMFVENIFKPEMSNAKRTSEDVNIENISEN